MFDKNFYPTPREVGMQMIVGLDLYNKVVLEPSAGKGDLIDLFKEMGAEVIACELHPDLAKISASKADRFLGNDFFLVDPVDLSHVDYIIANPPFDRAVDHILHMYEIAPGGCTIISLLNYESIISYRPTVKQAQLKSLIADHGNSECLGECFSTAERKTDVKVAMVTLFKPKSAGDQEFEGYFDMDEEPDLQGAEGVIEYNEVTAIVNSYIASVKLFDEVEAANAKMTQLVSPISNTLGISFGAYTNGRGNVRDTITRELFKRELQKSAWRTVFDKLGMKKFVTQKVYEQLNKFVEKQSNVPFTVKNVYKMLEMIVGTSGGRMNQVITEVFDRITKHHKENRFQVEGWKTNSQYRVNKKFILPYEVQVEYGGGMSYRYSQYENHMMDDLYKALCQVTGTRFDPKVDWHTFMLNVHLVDKHYEIRDREGKVHKGSREEHKSQYREFGKWYEFGPFVRFKGYKKGSLHVEFLNDEVWDKFNQIACKEKGFQLAADYTSDLRRKKTGVNKYV